MDVLIITNSILMLIPVLFAGLEFLDPATGFESGSLTQTSVVIVLPLGTLVAQRIATRGLLPDSDVSGPESMPLSDLNLTGGSLGGGNSHKDKGIDNGIVTPTNTATSFSSIAKAGVSCLPKTKRMTASSASSSQRPLLTTTRSTISTSNESSGFPSPGLGVHNVNTYSVNVNNMPLPNMPTMPLPNIPSNFPPTYPGYSTRNTGVTAHVTTGTIGTIGSDGRRHSGTGSGQLGPGAKVNRQPSVDHFDRELAAIDDDDDMDDDEDGEDGYPFESKSEKTVLGQNDDVEAQRGRNGLVTGGVGGMGGVRVQRTIETRSEERMPSPSPGLGPGAGPLQQPSNNKSRSFE